MNLRTPLLCLLLSVPATALAHAELEASSVEDGATITEPMGEVSLTFTEAAELGFSTFKVYPLPAEAATLPDGAAGADDHDASSGDHDAAAAEAGAGHDAEATGDHGDEGGHAALDAAAETLMAEVMDAPDDARARRRRGDAR